MLDDGTAGLRAVKEAGGSTVVLDPATTLYSGMPSSALASVAVDAVAPIDEIAAAIVGQARRPAEHGVRHGVPPGVEG